MVTINLKKQLKNIGKELKMTKKEKIEFIIEQLNELYPDAKCSLNYETPFQLLVATRLSAQCTDERVNKVTPALFAKYPSIEHFAKADFDELCSYIHSCGFYRAKAQSIIEMSNQLINDYNSTVPDTIEQLTKLSGIGRKTANLICGDIYGKPAIIADTHCIRLSNRLGLVTNTTDPVKVEKQLSKIIPAEHQTQLCHNLVFHGRNLCMARTPKCNECPLKVVCSFFNTTQSKRTTKTANK